MGLATTAVLVASNALVASIRHLVSPQVRIPIFVVLIATLVTLVDMALNAWLHDLYKVLGLFIALTDTGAEGLAPISSLGWEFFTHDEKAHALVGRETGTIFRLGDPVDVRLAEAAPITGGLRFEVIYDAGPRRSRGKPRKSGGPPRRRR